MEVLFYTKNAKETKKLGISLGKLLSEGDFVALTGDLGAGKTAFTKGIAEGLQVEEPVTSPTFTIINEYHDPISFAHMDVYRLKDVQELENIGFDDYLQDYVVVMEWADKVFDILPDEFLLVEFKILDDNLRQIRFVSKGPHYDTIVRELRK